MQVAAGATRICDCVVCDMSIILEEDFAAEILCNLKGMTERARRLHLGRISLELGYGGQTALAKLTGCSRAMIIRGEVEVKAGEIYCCGDRNRRKGGGRPTIEVTHRREMEKLGLVGAELDEAIDICSVVRVIVEKVAYGDPMTNNQWINTTTKAIGEEVFKKTSRRYSHNSIKKIVRKIGFSLQKNQKYNQVGKQHPKRNDQFEHIEGRKNDYLRSGDPIISIDTKAKEKLGDFIRPGRECRMKGCPRRVLDHDFALRFDEIYPNGSELVPAELLKRKAIVIPNGVYCFNNNTAHVSVGISHDTSEFAADSIRNWWQERGKHQFPHAKRLLILADGGGSNRVKGWLWKIACQQLSDDLELEIEMCHYPPGCSKYDPIERRLWSQVTHAWAAKPLKNLEIICGYISHTNTETGLSVTCEICSKVYMTEEQKKDALNLGIPVIGITDSKLLSRHLIIEFIGEDDDLKNWNYRLYPHPEDCRWHDYKMLKEAL